MEEKITTIIINQVFDIPLTDVTCLLQEGACSGVVYVGEGKEKEGGEERRRGRSKAEEIYVAGAEKPILGKTKVSTSGSYIALLRFLLSDWFSLTPYGVSVCRTLYRGPFPIKKGVFKAIQRQMQVNLALLE